MSDTSASPTPATPAAPPSYALPNPRHAGRIPPEVGPEQWQRIRQAAYQLPQVLSPADVEEGGSGHGEGRPADLDRLGLIMIQKAAKAGSGSRPSRWIEPRLVATALAHLDVVGAAPRCAP